MTQKDDRAHTEAIQLMHVLRTIKKMERTVDGPPKSSEGGTATNAANIHQEGLKRVMNSSGAWGVSHTRVPTESRPGHVAIIAGLYEDPSAIAKGWKENPVEFDSLFNQSRFTWSWGSPDILPMFARGASGDHVLTEMYGPEVEDFSGKNKTSVLDTWVFDRVELFLHSAKSDPVLSDKLQQDKLVFFLHLLGLDTAGHSHKPHSKEYLENIKVVDEGVKKMEQLFEEFYNHDERTTYIFTSDHGMTDWGSHGAGERSETETPLVAWGAGIRGPLLATETDPPSPRSWELAHIRRSDVKQADIAPLMATLLGVPIPANSVGFLPREYLSLSEFEVSEAVFTNARQMAAQYNRKRELTESGTISLLYWPFPQLTKSTEQTLLTEIRKHIEDGQFTHAYYVYCILPEVLWWAVLRRHEDMYAALRNTSKSRGLLSLLFPCALYLAGIEILVLSFFYRFVLSIGVAGLAVWPLVSLRIPWRLRIGWLASCASLAVFPSLPVVGREANTPLVVASGCVWIMCALMFIYWVSSSNFNDTPRAVGVLLLQVALLSVAVWNIQSTSSSLGNKQGLLSFNQSLSWTLSGNIASINSFDPTWVHCFLTVFSPFVMTALILWKTMIPFLAVTCVFRAVNIVVQAPTRRLFLIVLVFCDGMGLHFLHLVTNQGSWLDIGTSISHYVIMQTTVLFLLFLYEMARGLTSINIWTAFVCFPYRSSRHPSNMSLLDDGYITNIPHSEAYNPSTVTNLLYECEEGKEHVE
uniref:GPI ethanolamine phosphate transferase 1 n=1 Tax=Timema cristinae TaxID=61476 RepID=A0A7R9CSF1_TIMCR|nr:unnamed protein product [Timema cristinae]